MQKVKTSKLAKLNAFFLATSPVWAVYDILPGTSLSLLMIWLLVICNLTSLKKNVFKERRLEISLLCVIVLVSILGALCNVREPFFSLNTFINNFYQIFGFFIGLIFITQKVDVRVFRKTILFFGIAAAIICVFQRIQLLLTGDCFKNFFIPGLKLYRDVDSLTLTRVSAFFSEPAHLSIYLLPVFYWLLCEKRYIWGVLVATGILFSGATTGFVMLFPLIIVYAVSQHMNIFKVGLLLVLATGTTLLIVNLFPNIIANNLEKLATTEADDQRLLGGLQFLTLFSLPQWIFGIGINQLGYLLSQRGIFLVSEYGNDLNSNYAGAIIYMLLSYGVAGEVALITYLFQTYKKYRPTIGFFVVLLGVLFSDQVLFNMNFFYPLTFILLLKNNQQKGQVVGQY